MIEIKDIHLKFDRTILEKINLSIPEGQILGIVGKSGAGKTSLLKIIACLLQPTSGDVFFEGSKVAGPAVKLVPGHPEIQLVNQDFQLDIYQTVEENIRGKILYLPIKERNALTEELLHLIELDEVRNQKAGTLSGGEQQRLALARALACEPKILLLDEPFVHLDARLRSKFINYLLALRAIRKTTLVLVSHDGSEMLSLADVICSMKNGAIKRKGTPMDFYYKSKTIEDAKFFGAINSVKIDEKREFFRPNEFTICDSETTDEVNTLSIQFDHQLFTGPIYENYFVTENKEKIVLFSFNSLENVRRISICKK